MSTIEIVEVNGKKYEKHTLDYGNTVVFKPLDKKTEEEFEEVEGKKEPAETKLEEIPDLPKEESKSKGRPKGSFKKRRK